jgi:hypothetical protein
MNPSCFNPAAALVLPDWANHHKFMLCHNPGKTPITYLVTNAFSSGYSGLYTSTE